MIVAVVLVLLALLLFSFIFAQRYGIIWAILGSSIALLAGLIIFITIGSRDQQENVPRLQPINKNVMLSKPASWEQVKLEADGRQQQDFFSLGEPGDDYQLRVDLNKTSNSFQLGYLNSEAQRAFSASNPTFSYLLASKKLSAAENRAVIKAAGSQIEKDDFIIYLPRKSSPRQDVLFVASQQRQVSATAIVGPSGQRQELIDRLQLTASR